MSNKPTKNATKQNKNNFSPMHNILNFCSTNKQDLHSQHDLCLYPRAANLFLFLSSLTKIKKIELKSMQAIV